MGYDFFKTTEGLGQAMKRLIATVGLPASGKSTYARKIAEEFGSGNVTRVNKDDLRDMLDFGKWSPRNEEMVIKVRDAIIAEGLTAGRHVIVDDCNFGKHCVHLRQLAAKHDAVFEIADFSHVSPEECIERDLKRERTVGAKVIWDMYFRYLHKPIAPLDYNEALPSAVIVDLDGTLAQMVDRGPFDWAKVGVIGCGASWPTPSSMWLSAVG